MKYTTTSISITVKNRNKMKVSEFASEVANAEGKKVQTSIGNVREILSIINKKTNGEFYKLIKKLTK